MFNFSTIGVFLYFFYPILIISISIYVSLTKETTFKSYFFADRNINWFVIGISLIAPSVFSPYLLGFTSAGSFSGMPIIFGLISVIMLAVLGWFLVPIFIKVNVDTLPQYFEKRFNRACKYYVLVLYIFSNVLIRLLFILIAGNVFIKMITGVDPYFSILFFLIISSIYLIIGGLRAEFYVGIIQFILIFIVLASFVIWIINQDNGLSLTSNKVSFLTNFSSGMNSKFTWPELVFGLPIVGFWFWCSDQFVIQKIVSAPNVDSVRKASLTSAFLQVIPILIFISPGILVAELFPNIISEEFLPTLFNNGFLPISLKSGLIIAVAASLVASFASLFNSTSLLITSDLYRSFYPNSSDRKLVLVGRLSILVMLFCAVLLIPISQAFDFSFCIKLFNAFCYFTVLIATVFIISLINKRIKSVSAFITLCASTVVILLRISSEIFYGNHLFGSEILKWFTHSGFLEFSIFVFLLAASLLFTLNKTEWVLQITSSFKRAFSKGKINSGYHKKILLAIPVLAITTGALVRCFVL